MGKTTAYVILAIAALIVAAVAIVEYNKLAAYDEKVLTAWTPFDGVLKQRYEPRPKLVPEITIYIGQDVSAAEDLKKAYEAYLAAETIADRVAAANDTEDHLTYVMQDLAERYPDIVNGHEFQVIQDIQKKTADAMASLSSAFNAVATAYNTYSREFPSDVVALIFGFPGKYEYFETKK
jgi:LemA protein